MTQPERRGIISIIWEKNLAKVSAQGDTRRGCNDRQNTGECPCNRGYIFKVISIEIWAVHENSTIYLSSIHDP